MEEDFLDELVEAEEEEEEEEEENRNRNQNQKASRVTVKTMMTTSSEC